MVRCLWLIIRGLGPEVWSRRIKSRKQIIGRAPECAIQLFDERVSRQHAKIWERGGVVFVRDLNSRNGTFVDGARVRRCTLLSGKSLRIADITFEVITSQSTVRSTAFGRLNSTTVKHEIPLGVINTNFGGLSDGERRVLRLLVQGAAEKEVAATLGVSYHTVHAHVKQIYRELGVRSRLELITLCLAPPGMPSATGEEAAAKAERENRTPLKPDDSENRTI
jgi:pSer/pThr/pTyr-binding forkhead associated (FHA) protein